MSKPSGIINSIEDLFIIIRELRKSWEYDDKPRPGDKELWFRAEGEEHFQTRLQPGIFRLKNVAEHNSIPKLLSLEEKLYSEFDRRSSQLLPSDAKTIDKDWDPYFLMQHYGVPSRILDWTDSALISLHFAIRNKAIVSKDGAIIHVLDPYWVLDLIDQHPERAQTVGRWKKFCRKSAQKNLNDEDWERVYLPLGDDDPEEPLLNMPNIPLLWDSPHIARRVAAQRSRFMIFGADPDFLTTLESRNDSRLKSFLIKKEAIDSIRQDLRNTGITESVVFPDLDGLGRELKKQWEFERQNMY